MDCRGYWRVAPKVRKHGISSWWIPVPGFPAGDHFVCLGTESVFVVVDVPMVCPKFSKVSALVHVSSQTPFDRLAQVYKRHFN